MIPNEWRFDILESAIDPAKTGVWPVIDFDQRRIIGVAMDEEPDAFSILLGHVEEHIDSLRPDVHAIHLSKDGELLSVSSEQEDDLTMYVHYPRLEDFQLPSQVKTVLRSELIELERLNAKVDVVSYVCSDVSDHKPRKVIFKYYYLEELAHELWHEINLSARLPAHPNLVPFDRLVLDEVHGRVVGFTTPYISGHTLSEDTIRIFKLKWLRQLIGVLDTLAFKYGIAHQDVARRNLMVDQETDRLMLIDFGISCRIGSVNWRPFPQPYDIPKVVFTLYELITLDTSHISCGWSKELAGELLQMEKWVKHPDVKLDHSVKEFRSVLAEWVDRRQNGPQITRCIQAPNYIDWPDLPIPPSNVSSPAKVPSRAKDTWPSMAASMGWPEDGTDCLGHPNVPSYEGLSYRRRDAKKKGRLVGPEWERPPQAKLGDSKRLLATGTFVE